MAGMPASGCGGKPGNDGGGLVDGAVGCVGVSAGVESSLMMCTRCDEVTRVDVEAREASGTGEAAKDDNKHQMSRMTKRWLLWRIFIRL